MDRRIPSKEQVLNAARGCTGTKEVLKILFPDDFKEEFDWEEFKIYPFVHVQFENKNHIILSPELIRAYREKGSSIPDRSYPFVTLEMLHRLITFLLKNAG